MSKKTPSVTAVFLASGLVLAACAPTEGDANTDVEEVRVGIVYSETGPLAAYGETYRQGLEAGLDYATDGTREVDGTAITLTYRDDQGDTDTAVNVTRDLISQEHSIIAGTVVSGIALALAEQAEQNQVLYISGPAATDAIQGINDYTFRSGRQSLQDVATARAFLDEADGGTVVVFAQDTAFGQGNLEAVEATLGDIAEIDSVMVPEDTTEFIPFVRQLIDAEPDLVFVAWAGATSGSMWQALDQQGAFDEAPVVTGLGDRATYDAYGATSDQISFLAHYFPEAPENEINAAMVEDITDAGGTPDLFSPDGFVAGQMIVQAVAEGGDNVDEMIAALEGWSFEGPKGSYTIRESDHALLQEMYTAQLVDDGEGGWTPELLDTVPAEDVAPPE